MPPEQGRTALLERLCQGMSGVEGDTDPPAAPPPDDARHCRAVLEPPHQAIASQAPPRGGDPPQPALTPEQPRVRQTGSKQATRRRFPCVLPPVDPPQRWFGLAQGRFAPGPAVLPLRHRSRCESGPARDEDGLRRAAFVLGRAPHPLPGRPTAAIGAEHRGPVAARLGRRRPWPEGRAPLRPPAMGAALGHDLIPATAQPVAPRGRAQAPVQTPDQRRPPLPRPSTAACHLPARACAGRDSGLCPAEPRCMAHVALGTRRDPERCAARLAAVAPQPGVRTALGPRPNGQGGARNLHPPERLVDAVAGRDARALASVPGPLCKLRDLLPGTGPQRPCHGGLRGTTGPPQGPLPRTIGTDGGGMLGESLSPTAEPAAGIAQCVARPLADGCVPELSVCPHGGTEPGPPHRRASGTQTGTPCGPRCMLGHGALLSARGYFLFLTL